MRTRIVAGSKAPKVAGLIAVMMFPFQNSSAQKLVDPSTVASEYREAAEKRRTEQLRMQDCTRKANEAKVLPRDRTAHIQTCLDAK